ncbi:MAG: hypothetical protein H6Q90_6905 [Deltaproteobacteria bacterium]|nr:hypothetical protein [Deltaproteobacteria bacterium]
MGSSFAGENATLRRWNGVSWLGVVAPAVSVGSDGRRAITQLAGASSSDLWAATSSGEVFHFDGTTWTRSARLSVGLSTIARAPSGAMFAAGHNGAIFRRAP